MKLTITKQKRSFLLYLPLIAIPFICLVFHTLGGGRGGNLKKNGNILGLNTQLPAAPFDLQKAFQDKLKTYEKANSDSARKAQFERQDPYRRDTTAKVVAFARKTAPSVPAADMRAEALTQQLAQLRQSLHPERPGYHPPALPADSRPLVPVALAPDPQIERLNAMLDKVIRIQHPQAPAGAEVKEMPKPVDDIGSVDSTVNCITAMIPQDQVLTAGTTVTLRITDAIRVNGQVLPAGQLVYGTVTLNNDRLLVHIASLRAERNLYTTDWQVYDLDGLAGIHIPGVLGRDVAKQSADQGVNSLNVVSLDPGMGAQMASAGITAAKTFLGRKVRQVRVTVPAGYIVLLRNAREKSWTFQPHAAGKAAPGDSICAPDFDPTGGVLEECRQEGVEVLLRDILIKDSCLWFGLEWRNRSPIAYTPGYIRWSIRHRRMFKRTAEQEEALEPLGGVQPTVVTSDSLCHSWTAFHPFALPKGKELVLEVGEKGGGRTLSVIISHQEILKARIYAEGSKE